MIDDCILGEVWPSGPESIFDEGSNILRRSFWIDLNESSFSERSRSMSGRSRMRSLTFVSKSVVSCKSSASSQRSSNRNSLYPSITRWSVLVEWLRGSLNRVFYNIAKSVSPSDISCLFSLKYVFAMVWSNSANENARVRNTAEAVRFDSLSCGMK